MSYQPELHALIDPPSPAYTNMTVRRAFIVWLHCGQINKFKDVCNYFHQLEALEEKMSLDNRVNSRRLEFDLFTNSPPVSTYLSDSFPNLYPSEHPADYFIRKLEAIRNEKNVFKLEGFQELCPKSGVTKQMIVETSQMIRNYCLSRSLTLKRFLQEFKGYTTVCRLTNSICNASMYINKKKIEAEMTMIINCPKTYGFLEEDKACDRVEKSANFLNSQRRLLDSIKLSPTMEGEGIESWIRENLRNKLVNAKQVFVKQSIISLKRPLRHGHEVIMSNAEYVDRLKERFKSELVVS